jgi:hypothetical protein
MANEEDRYAIVRNNAKAKLCNAKLADGRQCNAMAIKDRDFCKFHGGKNPTGIDSPEFRTGLWSNNRKRFSTVAPELLEKIDQFRNDPELYSLRDDTAYITAILDLRAEAASHGVSLDLYEQLKDQYSVCKMAPPEAFDKEFKNLGRLITSGIDAIKASDDVIDLIKKRSEVIETEQRMMHAKSYTLEVDQAYSLIMQVFGVVKQTIRDPDQIRAIAEGITKLLKIHQGEEEDILDAEVID